MNANPVIKADKLYSGVFLRTGIAGIVGAIIMIALAIVLKDPEKGLLKVTTAGNLFQAVVAILVLYICFEYIWLSINVVKKAHQVQLISHPSTGLFQVVTSICFLLQGVFDILYLVAKKEAEKGMSELALAATSSKSSYVVSVVLITLTLLSAVSFGFLGFEAIMGIKKKRLLLEIIPIFWGVFTLLHVMVTFPTVVSMQGDYAKVICCILVLLFLYFSTQSFFGFEFTESSFSPVKSVVALFVRLSFPMLMLVLVVPFCIVPIFGVSDSMKNMPYIAIFGLFLLSLVMLFQFMALSLLKIKREYKLK